MLNLNKKVLYSGVFFLSSKVAFCTNIGIIKMDDILKSMPEVEKIKGEFKVFNEKLEEEIKKKIAEVQEKFKNIKDEASLTEAQKVELQKEAQNIQSYEKDVTSRRDSFIKNKMEPLNNKIKEAIRKVASKEKLDMVLTSNSVEYYEKNIDFTLKVISELKNSEIKAKL
jgi:Skp family chaperone for outer membrane proteins